MKYIKKFEYENKENNFFCYIPYVDKFLFSAALDKIKLPYTVTKEKIIEYLDEIWMFDDIKYEKGFFISIYDPNSYIVKNHKITWNYTTFSDNEDFNEIVENMKNEWVNTYIEYIGEIRLEDWEINAIKYNI